MPQDAFSSGTSPAEADSLIDFRTLADYGTFALRAVSRRRALVALVFAAVVTCISAALLVWPKTYHSEATLLARRNDLMNTLSNPTRPARPEADDPTSAAAEIVHDRDNLLMIIRQADLMNEWERTRSAFSRLKEQFGHRPTDEERLNSLVWLLGHQIFVVVEKEGVVRIGVDWIEPHMAQRLAHLAVQNFIDRRHQTETDAIGNAISILQDSAASLQSDVDRTIAQLRTEQGRRAQPAGRTHPAAVPSSGAAAPAADRPAGADAESIAELGRLKDAVEAKRREVQALEVEHKRQLDDAQGKLKAALGVYTEDHPTVISLRQNVASVSREPAELAPLRIEAQLLDKQYAALENSVRPDRGGGVAALASVMALPRPSSVPPKARGADDVMLPAIAVLPPDVQQLTDLVHPASRLLSLQLAQLANLLDRINSARLELATSGAGLKFRYVITHPAEVPRSPLKPKVPLILAAGSIAALLLAFAAAVVADLATGKILEQWQLERQLDLHVFGVLGTQGAQ